MSLQTFADPECEWTHYCDVCGTTMVTVVRESQKREPAQRRLAEPPKVVSETPPPAKPPTPAKPPAPALPPAKAPVSEGYNLLELMGWRK